MISEYVLSSGSAGAGEHDRGADGGERNAAPERDMEDLAGLEEDFFRADLRVVLIDAVAELRMKNRHDSCDQKARAEDNCRPIAHWWTRLQIGRHSRPIVMSGGC